MDNELEELFPEEDTYHPKFDGHVVTVTLLRGKSEMPSIKIECKESDIKASPCRENACSMQELFDYVGWDAVSAAGEIELARLSARVDWSDPDEPWIEVEP